MADLFTHILVGYVVVTALSWRWAWISPQLVTVAMVGSTLPDLNRIDLVLPDSTVEELLSLSFSWTPLHRAGGTLVMIAVGSLLVPKRLRRGVFALLLLGVGSHYALDFLLYKPAGVTADLLWPFTGRQFVIDGFYLSSDRWPAAVATVLALGAWAVDRVVTSPKHAVKNGDG
ncbi:LexA-binding, inner membrane-associated putative hydrolase [Halovenus aranensis]|uniref:LexA-binding, inner membrane-associated putative hydrolase n=2 Tax=Halovenus aranensis TaxID=890420 RepID=A0A1G8ZNJ4_9EURY|nr:metal-dependent hydrolase [Halovenus aranensis]SDK16607.1 LexA-binding, inner membrane-associated putative hydrolase [Halovenus aranensis]